jgi:hypothetical protein
MAGKRSKVIATNEPMRYFLRMQKMNPVAFSEGVQA